MTDPFAELRRTLEASVLSAPGETSEKLRRQVAARTDVPHELAAIVDKVHDRAYAITDEEVSELRRRYDDDTLFELIAAAAIGAAGRRLDAALNALEEADDASRQS